MEFQAAPLAEKGPGEVLFFKLVNLRMNWNSEFRRLERPALTRRWRCTRMGASKAIRPQLHQVEAGGQAPRSTQRRILLATSVSGMRRPEIEEFDQVRPWPCPTIRQKAGRSWGWADLQGSFRSPSRQQPVGRCCRERPVGSSPAKQLSVPVHAPTQRHTWWEAVSGYVCRIGVR